MSTAEYESIVNLERKLNEPDVSKAPGLGRLVPRFDSYFYTEDEASWQQFKQMVFAHKLENFESQLRELSPSQTADGIASVTAHVDLDSKRGRGPHFTLAFKDIAIFDSNKGGGGSAFEFREGTGFGGVYNLNFLLEFHKQPKELLAMADNFRRSKTVSLGILYDDIDQIPIMKNLRNVQGMLYLSVVQHRNFSAQFKGMRREFETKPKQLSVSKCGKYLKLVSAGFNGEPAVRYIRYQGKLNPRDFDYEITTFDLSEIL